MTLCSHARLAKMNAADKMYKAFLIRNINHRINYWWFEGEYGLELTLADLIQNYKDEGF
ncbi:unnamed protein product [marine sediment metagenome]|uniref:Uncharacterized protein n=1 Tax=marine sediment metagenome TaxID=412755 RepID=X0S9T2_9ZZZZ